MECNFKLKKISFFLLFYLHFFSLIFKEPSSTSGKRELIAGERGILQGVSTILLVFDESEVRKILKICRQVLEYLSITELIEKMDDLVTYVKNLTPIHQIHVNLLSQHLEQVKQLVPLFISSIKTCIIIGLTFKNADSLKMRIDQNKEYLIKRLTTEIKEIIRIFLH